MEHTFQNEKSLIGTQSDTLLPLRTKGFENSAAALCGVHTPQVQAIAFCSLSTVFTSGSCPASRWTSRGKSLRIWPVSAADSHKRMSLLHYQTTFLEPPSGEEFEGHFQCRKTAEAARPTHAKRPSSRTAIPPVSTSCAFLFDSDFTCGRLCADLTAPTQLDPGASFVTRVPATNPAVLTADTDPINSRASGAGLLACFGLQLRERPCVGWKCQQAQGYLWAFATMLGSS